MGVRGGNKKGERIHNVRRCLDINIFPENVIYKTKIT